MDATESNDDWPEIFEIKPGSLWQLRPAYRGEYLEEFLLVVSEPVTASYPQPKWITQRWIITESGQKRLSEGWEFRSYEQIFP